LNFLSSLYRRRSPEHNFPRVEHVCSTPFLGANHLHLHSHCPVMGRSGFLHRWKPCKQSSAYLHALQMDPKKLWVWGWQPPPPRRLLQEQPKNEPRLQVEHPRPALGSRATFDLSQKTNSQISLQMLCPRKHSCLEEMVRK